MSGSPTPLEQSRRSGCALLHARAVAGTDPGHQHPGRCRAAVEQMLRLHPRAAASSSLPQETGQAQGSFSLSLRAKPGSAHPNHRVRLKEAGLKPLHVSASPPALPVHAGSTCPAPELPQPCPLLLAGPEMVPGTSKPCPDSPCPQSPDPTPQALCCARARGQNKQRRGQQQHIPGTRMGEAKGVGH